MAGTAVAISAFDKSMNRMDKKVAKWLKEDYKRVLESVDNITRKLSKLRPILEDVAGRDWNIYLRMIDQATDPVKGILRRIKSEIQKARSDIALSIKFQTNLPEIKSEIEYLNSKLIFPNQVNNANTKIFQIMSNSPQSPGIEKPEISGKKLDRKASLSLNSLNGAVTYMEQGPKTIEKFKKFYESSELLAMQLGAGDIGKNASLPSPVLSGLGMAAQAGAVKSADTLLSAGSDFFNSFQSTDKLEKNAYMESGAKKTGGVATGAMAGALIGGFIPGVGHLVGGLIGGGIGGLLGEWSAKKTMEEYEEETKQIALAAEQAKYKSKELKEAIADSSMSAEEFGKVFQKAVGDDLTLRLGKVRLSMSEINDYVDRIVFDGQTSGVQEFVTSVADAEKSLANLTQLGGVIQKMEWKRTHVGLTEEETEEYNLTIDQYGENAHTALYDKEYEAHMGLEQIYGKGAELPEGVSKTFENRHATIDEEVINMKNTPSDKSTLPHMDLIDAAVSGKDADYFAMLEEEKAKFEASDLSRESYQEMVGTVKQKAQEYYQAQDLALEKYLNVLNESKLSEDPKEDAKAKIAEKERAEDRVKLNKEAFNDKVVGFYQEAVFTPYAKELKTYANINDMDELTKKVTEFAQEGSLVPDSIDSLAEAIGLNKDLMNKDTYNSLMGVLQEYVNTLPPEELKVDKGKKAQKEAREAKEKEEAAKAAKEAEELINSQFEQVWEDYYLPNLTNIRDDFNIKMNLDYIKEQTKKTWMSRHEQELSAIGGTENLRQAGAGAALNPEVLNEKVSQYDSNDADGVGGFAALDPGVMGKAGQAMQESFSTLINNLDLFPVMPQTESPSVPEGASVSQSYNVEPIAEISEEAQTLIDEQIQGTVDGEYDLATTVNVGISYALSNASAGLAFTSTGKEDVKVSAAITGSGAQQIDSTVSGGKEHKVGYEVACANGGLITNPIVSLVGEDGPEAIIPLGSKRRGRGLSLWQQAGAALGVSQYAEGGLIGGYGESLSEEEEAVPLTSEDNSSKTEVKVEVAVSPKFEIGSNGGSEESIMGIIKAHMKEMADALGGEIAGKLEGVFSNMPLAEG